MIGLTGGIASGKSTVTRRLVELGAFVADADSISRDIVLRQDVLDAIRLEFGADVIKENGSLDRAALSDIVFSSDDGVKRLNAITHPAIIDEIILKTSLAEASGRYPLVFVDAPLLIESGLNRLCGRVWLVTADAETRIQRILLRDGLTREAAENRIARQLTDDEKRLYADVVIENNGTPAELLERVDAEFNNELAELFRLNAEEEA